jgi:hypothetical protein
MNRPKLIKVASPRDAVNLALIGIALVSIVLLGVSCWREQPTSEGWKLMHEFAMHLLVAMIEVLITVNIVEEIVRRDRLSKNLPFRAAVYLDLCGLNNRLVGFWFELFQHSVSVQSLSRIEDLYSLDAFEEIFRNLDLNAAAPVRPPIPVSEWISKIVHELLDQIDKLRDRYSGHLDPQIHYLLTEVMNSPMTGSMLQAKLILKLSVDMKIPRPTVLMVNSTGPDEEAIRIYLKIYKWLLDERKDLTVTFPDLLKPSEIFKHSLTASLTCKIDPVVLRRQTDAFSQHPLGAGDPMLPIPTSPVPPFRADGK